MLETQRNKPEFADIYMNLFYINSKPSIIWYGDDNDIFLFDYNQAANKLNFLKSELSKGILLKDFLANNHQIGELIIKVFQNKEKITHKIEYKSKDKKDAQTFCMNCFPISSNHVVVEFESLKKANESLENIQSKESKIYENRNADLITSRDITKLKKGEKELYLNKFAVDRTSIEVYWTLSNSKIIYVNDSACKDLGYSREELLNMKIYDIDPEYPIPVWNEHWDDLKKKRTLTFISFHQRKNGKIFPVEITANYIKFNGIEYNIAFAKDITERVNAKEALKESEEKFRTIAEQSLMGILITQNKKIEYINQACAEIWGYRVEEMRNWTIEELKDLIHPSDKDFVFEQNKIKKAVDLDCVTNYQFQGIKKSGENIWIDIFSKFIIYKGKTANMVTFLDLTFLKKAEKELKDSEQKYRDMAELLPDILYEVNEKLDITYTNPIGLEKFGYSVADFRNGVNLLELISPEHLEKVSSRLKSIFQGKGTIPKEYLLLTKNGDKFFARVNSRPIIKDGKTVGLRGTVTDINEMVMANLKLKDSQEKYYKLFDYAPFAILLFSIDGKIIDCNSATENMARYARQELIGKNFSEFNLCPDISKEYLEDRIKLNNKGIAPDPREIQIFKKDGSTFDALSHLSFINLGTETYIQAIIQDISERKRAEQELIKLNHLKTDLLRRTSHELKTPLVSIKGFSDLLLQVHYKKLDAEIITLINEIKGGCSRLEYLINDILKAARLESGEIPLRLEQEDLTFLIKFTLKEIKPLADMRNQKIHLNIHENLSTLMEKEKIHDVISNLLTNAIKNTPINGNIEISTKIKDNLYFIQVKDDGIGLTEEEKSHLFKQFGKIERYGKGWDLGIEGSGLGLYISKKIIEAHRGRIWAESKGRNMGSVFLFTLPIKNK